MFSSCEDKCKFVSCVKMHDYSSCQPTCLPLSSFNMEWKREETTNSTCFFFHTCPLHLRRPWKKFFSVSYTSNLFTYRSPVTSDPGSYKSSPYITKTIHNLFQDQWLKATSTNIKIHKGFPVIKCMTIKQLPITWISSSCSSKTASLSTILLMFAKKCFF